MAETVNENENKKTGWGKKLGIGCLGLIVLFVVLVALAGGGSQQSKEEVAAPPSTTPFSEKEEITEDVVRAEVQELPGFTMEGGELVDVRVVEHMGTEDNPDDRIVYLHYRPESIWDDKSLVKETARTAVEVMEKLFKNPKVGLVSVWVETEFTDQYGKSSVENAVKVGLERATADKIEWENFKDLVLLDYNRLLDIADAKYIHPAVRKNL